MNNILLSPISLDDLKQVIRECLNETILQKPINCNTSIDECTIETAEKIYEVDKTSFYNWHNQGIITIKKLGGRSYVSKSEISKAMVSFKSKKQKASK